MVTRHTSRLVPAWGDAAVSGVALLDLRVPDFVPMFLQRLVTAPGRDRLREHLLAPEGEEFVLHQPVHRVFHIAALGLECEVPGQPRVDPAKIESAGLILRRVGRSHPNDADVAERVHEMWLADAGSLSWRQVPGVAVERSGEQLEGDPWRRRLPATFRGSAALRRLWEASEGVASGSEEFVPLFVAPPEVAADSGRTILWGVIPTADGRVGEEPVGGPLTPEEVRGVLPTLLSSPDTEIELPLAGRRNLGLAQLDAASGESIDRLLRTLRFLRLGIDVLEPTDAVFASGDLGTLDEPAPDAATGRARLRAVLAGITLVVDESTETDALTLLERGSQALLDRDTGVRFDMPEIWPALTEQTVVRCANAVAGILAEQGAAIAPRRGRFSDPKGRYRIHCFVRLDEGDGCPPRIVWSRPSCEFRIAAWFESANVPTLPVELPNPFDQAALRKLSPNVAFAVPDPLMNLLRRLDPLGLLEKKAPDNPESDGGIQWICGFSIPIITICAFILLMIVLVLLHLVFFWLPFVWVCLPFPKRRAAQ